MTEEKDKLLNILDGLKKHRFMTGDGTQDYYRFHIRRFRKILSCIDFKPKQKILDVGSSPAYIAKALKDYGCDVEAIDFYLPTLFKDIPTHVMNIETEKFPFKNGTFDIVLFCDVIEHLLFNPEHVLKEIARVLRPEGIMILNTPNANAPYKHIAMLLGKNIQGDYHIYFNPQYHKGTIRGIYARHSFEWTLDQLKQILHDTGFTIRSMSWLHKTLGFREEILITAVSKREGNANDN